MEPDREQGPISTELGAVPFTCMTLLVFVAIGVVPAGRLKPLLNGVDILWRDPGSCMSCATIVPVTPTRAQVPAQVYGFTEDSKASEDSEEQRRANTLAPLYGRWQLSDASAQTRRYWVSDFEFGSEGLRYAWGARGKVSVRAGEMYLEGGRLVLEDADTLVRHSKSRGSGEVEVWTRRKDTQEEASVRCPADFQLCREADHATNVA
eukprot:TRINITY_DN21096_c0_g1_i16.p1 TRINITY_DN21096_c0_g1~~TRINITY_DN21096_c0_g1_i16.p1  ORF type:complete len:207 (+),score=6.93 TRINITY_DN21096_c0_g1_i16:524-1144(+)